MNRPVLRRILSVVLCSVLMLGAVPAVRAAGSDAEDLNIATFSDIRYYPDFLAGDKGEAYYSYTQSAGVSGRDQDALLKATFASLREQAKNDGLDCVVVCGDLTLNGEYDAAAALAHKLRLFSFESGIKVYVLNGDRDINNPRASEFSRNIKQSARGITQAEFLELFDALGYQDAYHVYKPLGDGTQGALSYSVRPKPGYRLILADCCRYTADCTEYHEDVCERDCAFSDDQFRWVLEEAADAKQNGETPLLFTHAGIVPVNDFEEYLQKDALVEDAYTMRDRLAQAGVLCSFSAGANVSDTGSYASDSGNPLYGVSAPSVTQFPFAYRLTRFDAGNDGTVDLYFEQHDCDDTTPVKATGDNTYPSPYRAIGFAKQFGGTADAAAYLEGLAREALTDLCDDIIQAGGVTRYLETKLGLDVRGAVVSAVGNGLHLGPYTVVSSENVISFLEDLDAVLMEKYVRRPSNLFGAVRKAAEAFVSVKVSDVPCSRHLLTYGFGDRETGGTLGDLIFSLLVTVKPGNEDISEDAFLRDALQTCAAPAFARQLVETFRAEIVDGILVNEILANTEFRINTLFSDGIFADALDVQLFFSVVIAVAASRLMEAQSGGEAWTALSNLVSDGSVTSVGDVLDLILNAGESSSGRTVEQFLDTVFSMLFGEEQLAAIGDQIGVYLDALCYDDTADHGCRYEYRGPVVPSGDERDMRIPSMVQLAVNGNNSFTVTWFTKYSVTGTDIEIVKEGNAFTGTPTESDLIASQTMQSSYNGYAFDCGNYGLFPYTRPVVRHVITVRGLVAGTRFRFRIGDALKGYWKECSLETGLEDRSFSFLNICETDAVTSAMRKDILSALREAVDGFSPSFIIHSGNLVRNPGSDAQWAAILDGGASVFSRAPLMYASGVNDANGDYSVQKHLTYSRTPTQYKENGVFYAFEYGSAHFAVLNTNALDADGTLSDQQVSWLKNDLGASGADWKFLVLSDPVFCIENSNDKLERELNTIINQYRVDVVLEGGAGSYLRSHLMKEGVVTDALVDYVTRDGRDYPVCIENGCCMVVSSGVFGGGAKELPIRNSHTALAERVGTPMFTALTVDGDTMYLSAYTVKDGQTELVDCFGMRKDSVSFLQGDADLDGSVTSADARLALRIAVGIDTVTPVTKAAADYDGDIKVSPADARLILRASVGLENPPTRKRVFLYDMAQYRNA